MLQGGDSLCVAGNPREMDIARDQSQKEFWNIEAMSSLIYTFDGGFTLISC
jgi:hypothetical protein